MPGKRKQSRSSTHITAEEVGGSDSRAVAELAVAGEYPEDYEEEGSVWKAGYDLAARKGNTPKACIVFANNYQGEDLSDAAIEDEIARLQRIQQERGAS